MWILGSSVPKFLVQGSERNKKWRFKIAGFCAESGLQMYFVWPAWCFLKVWINGKYFTVQKFCIKMQVSNLWKIRISDYGEPAPHKHSLAELSDWIFWTMLQCAIVPTTASSPCALTRHHCACTAAFSSIWSGVVSLHPLPQVFFLERLSLEPFLPSLVSGPLFPVPV